jgi:hypothetical protein
MSAAKRCEPADPAIHKPGDRNNVTGPVRSDHQFGGEWRLLRGEVVALTSTGLTNGGTTAHYQFQYDNSLSGPEPARTNAIIAACENDFNLMAGWFGNIGLDVNFPISVNMIPPGQPGACSTPGACWSLSSGNLTVTISDSNLNTISANFVRYLFVLEMVEQFMRAQGTGWYGSGTEGSEGEGLSRFLAAQFLAINGLGNPPAAYTNSNLWLSSSRVDYVNSTDRTDDGPDVKTGCALLFIYYMFTQLGYGTNDIVASGAPTLGGVYSNLTGDGSDPFPLFSALLGQAYPGTSTISGANLDNPFPLFYPAVGTRTIRSAEYRNVYLRMDGSGITSYAPYGAGTINCQSGAGPDEKFQIVPQGDGSVAIASVAFPNVYLRMDSSGITSFAPYGAGTVNCQFGVGPDEKFRIVPQGDGSVAIASVAFSNVYLRMDGSGVTSFAPYGAGTVNCQFGVGPSEKFRL